MKVVLCGPPRSGKSCLRQGLKDAVRALPGAPYPYVITACPDGEGSWFQETVNNDPAVAAQLKAAYKSKFTPEFVTRITDSVRNVALPLVLVDIGGIPSAACAAVGAKWDSVADLPSHPPPPSTRYGGRNRLTRSSATAFLHVGREPVYGSRHSYGNQHNVPASNDFCIEGWRDDLRSETTHVQRVEYPCGMSGIRS